MKGMAQTPTSYLTRSDYVKRQRDVFYATGMM